jgi:hypothetical protein
MSAYVELIDVENNEYEFFDATGRRLNADVCDGRLEFKIVEERRPEPERLTALLRSYFERLPKHLREFTARAQDASSLEELVALRQEIAHRPRASLLKRWSRRSRLS